MKINNLIIHFHYLKVISLGGILTSVLILTFLFATVVSGPDFLDIISIINHSGDSHFLLDQKQYPNVFGSCK